MDSIATRGPIGQVLQDGRPWCTGTVIASRSGSVVVIAGHCAYTPPRAPTFVALPEGAQPGPVTGLTFVPARRGQDTPFGAWRVDRTEIVPGWRNSNEAQDVAFLHVTPKDGTTIQQTVGAALFAAPERPERTAGPVEAVGYAVLGRFPGDQPYRCSTVFDAMQARRPTYASGLVWGMSCDLTPGASGGPWITKTDQAGVGLVVGVTSAIRSGPSLWGIVFEENAASALARIDHP